MVSHKLSNLLSVASLAVLACSLVASPVNALDEHHISRRGHDSIAKRRRDSAPHAKRCKVRSSSAAESSTASAAVAYVASSSDASTWTSTSDAAWTSSTDAAWTSSSAWVATSTSTSAAVATSAASSSSGGGKVGIAWALGDDSSLSNFKTDKTKYLYTWSPSMPTGAAELGFTLMPMLWGWNQVSEFQSTVVAGYANYVLGMNEPNEAGQSNMDAATGASMWQTYIQPLANEGYKLISPATSSAPSGMTWMKDFFAACSGCTFDGVAVHWYDVGADTFKTYVTSFHDAFNMDIWVTEYACQNFNGGAQCTDDQVWAFMEATKSWMEETEWIAAYFAFGVMTDMSGVNDLDRLMESTGLPTDLGYYYINN